MKSLMTLVCGLAAVLLIGLAATGGFSAPTAESTATWPALKLVDQNILVSQKLSEYHTGYRAFSREVLETIKLDQNSDDFVFDNQMLSQIIMADFEIAEVTCPTKYFAEASSINFKRSSIYGLGVLGTSLQHRLHRWGLAKNPRY